MARKFFVYLFSSRLKLLDFEFVSFRLLIVVMTNSAMTFETQRYCIFQIARSALSFRNDVVNFDVNTTCFLAQAAVSIAPQQNFGS